MNHRSIHVDFFLHEGSSRVEFIYSINLLSTIHEAIKVPTRCIEYRTEIP